MIQYDFTTTTMDSRWWWRQVNRGPYFRGQNLRYVPMEWVLMWRRLEGVPCEYWTITYSEDNAISGDVRLPYNWCFV